MAILAVAFGVPGLAVFFALAAGCALARPRFALLAGVLLAAGALWLFFTTQAVVFCAINPSSCSGPAPGPFAVISAVVLGAGVLTLVWTRRRLDSRK
jgi:hypothetical protein